MTAKVDTRPKGRDATQIAARALPGSAVPRQRHSPVNHCFRVVFTLMEAM